MIAFLGLVVIALGVIFLAFPDSYRAVNKSTLLGPNPDSGRILCGAAAILIGVALLIVFSG